ncbi:MAG: methyl-accepting chemotaxis protein [Desulfobacterales bacterium]|nr:methyl-accepting chemotaxis protein [Desulfobacterales bacterium]
MNKFSRLSLMAKILFVSIASLSGLTLVLFVLYSYNAKEKIINAYVGKARAITLTAESTRQEMENKWAQGIFSLENIRSYAEQGQMEKVLSMVPVVSAWNAAMRKAEQGGYSFRVPKFSPRRPENEPDYGMDYQIEGPALKKMKAENLSEFYIVDERINAVRYFLPVRLSENCMICHGDPVTSKALWGNEKGIDPTGGKMENWKVGEIHGAFEVIQSLDQAMKETRNDLLKAGVVAGAGIFLVMAIFYLIVSRNVVRPIQYIINGLDDGSGQVAEASSSVSGSSQSLADGSSTQAAAVEEISSALEEVSSMTSQNAENATNADQLMDRANTVVREANASMASLSQSMDTITSASEETSKIIKTIDEIAFQTNLLALNAAVEAARAGEAGAGFAVVADEVRALALRTAEAARTTTGLIEKNVTSTQKGTRIVNKTSEEFSQVMSAAKKVSTLVSEIAASSKEQSLGIEQVNKSISEVEKVTQQSAATAEESAASSEELNAQAETMSDYIRVLGRIVKGGGDIHKFDQMIKTGSDSDKSGPKLLSGGKEVSPDQIIPHDEGRF